MLWTNPEGFTPPAKLTLTTDPVTGVHALAAQHPLDGSILVRLADIAIHLSNDKHIGWEIVNRYNIFPLIAGHSEKCRHARTILMAIKEAVQGNGKWIGDRRILDEIKAVDLPKIKAWLGDDDEEAPPTAAEPDADDAPEPWIATVENERRAARADQALMVCEEEDEHTRLVDLLADLMHMAARDDLDFDAALNTAATHFEEERTEEEADDDEADDTEGGAA